MKKLPLNIRKYGKTPSGVQRYLDKDTGKVFLAEKKGLSEEMKKLACMMYFKGMSLRSVGNLLGYSNVAVLKWVRKYGDELKKTIALPCEIEANNTVYEHVEIDEFFTYVKKKLKKSTYGSQSTELMDRYLAIMLAQEEVKTHLNNCLKKYHI